MRSSNSLPRSRATIPGSLSIPSAANDARTTLCGLAEPSDFVNTLLMPADSTTARTAPPAMMPVPSGAGFSSTDPAPNRPSQGCGIVDPLIGTRTSAFLADSIAFLIADGTSFALPMPKPTTPWTSPTTTRALKLRFLPPLTTFVTRLMETTVSFSSRSDGSIFSRETAMSELQSGFAGGVGHRANPAVIQMPAAVEHDARDPLLLEPVGNDLAERFGARAIAAAHLAGEHALQARLGAACGRHGVACEIVDDLRVDVRHRSEDG